MGGVSVEKTVVLEQEQRQQLESFSRSRALPHALVLRARIVLLAAGGKQNKEIVEVTGIFPLRSEANAPYSQQNVRNHKQL